MSAIGFSWVVLLLFGFGMGGSADRRADPPAASKSAFEAVMRHVEPGGDLLLVLNTENFVQGLTAGLVELGTAVTEGKTDEDALAARRVLAALPAFLERQGFLALQAVGLSSVPEGRTHRSRAFLLRSVTAAESPLWRGLVGGKPRALVSHTYWTEDVAWAASGTGEAGELWKVLRGIVNELIPEAREEFEEGLAEAGENLGVDVEALVASLGDENFVAMTLDRAATFTVPQLNAQLPVPSLLLGLRLKEPLLAQRLETALKELEDQMPLSRMTVGDVTLTSVPVPVPAPFPVQPTLAYRAADGMLLIGSSAECVRKALEAATTGQNRLLDAPAFVEEVGGPVADNNGILYVGRRFTDALGVLHKAAVDQATARSGDAGELMVLKRFGQMFALGAYDVTVIVNQPEGVQLLSRGTAGPERMLQAGMVAPVGIVAAIAIPSFVKAREAAQRAACMSNLRQIEGAKEQWALEQDKENGAEPDEAGVAEYLHGGLPVCPKAKTPYRLNTIGTSPECTSGEPGHVLP